MVKTRPYDIEAVHRVGGYTPFGSHITMLRAVDDGVWISTLEEVYFVTDDAATPKGPYAAIPGTATVSKGELFGNGSAMTGKVVWWMSAKGICIGGNSGQFRCISEQVVTVQRGDRGAGLFRDIGGQRHYLSIVDGIAA
jgi:hypothetical protein